MIVTQSLSKLCPISRSVGASVAHTRSLRGDTVSRRLVWLRRVHTGNINGYAALAAVGMIVVSCTLML